MKTNNRQTEVRVAGRETEAPAEVNNVEHVPVDLNNVTVLNSAPVMGENRPPFEDDDEPMGEVNEYAQRKAESEAVSPVKIAGRKATNTERTIGYRMDDFGLTHLYFKDGSALPPELEGAYTTEDAINTALAVWREKIRLSEVVNA